MTPSNTIPAKVLHCQDARARGYVWDKRIRPLSPDSGQTDAVERSLRPVVDQL